MTTFYDYEEFVTARHTTYVLRANGKMLPVGGCVVTAHDGGWQRRTRWHSKHGIRYQWFADLDQALTSGIAWARQREAQEIREAAAPPLRSTPTLVRSAS
jgi:hypothetical protein